MGVVYPGLRAKRGSPRAMNGRPLRGLAGYAAQTRGCTNSENAAHPGLWTVARSAG